MKHMKISRRFICILAALALAFTLVPAAVLAEDTPEPSGTPGASSASPIAVTPDALQEGADKLTDDMQTVIASFEALAPEIASQSCAAGELESAIGVTLPSTLKATDDKSGAVTINGVTWNCTAATDAAGTPLSESPAFDPAVEGQYTFTAKLPEGYALAGDVTLPTITVTVTPPLMMAMAATGGDGTRENPFTLDNTTESIQSAINAATSGSTLNFAEGTFTFDSAVNIPKTITITGAGKDKTIIKSADGFRHFTTGKVDVTITDRKLEGPGASGGTDGAANGGIKSEGGTLTLARVTITDCRNDFSDGIGGGVDAESNATLIGCTVTDNKADYGGGVYLISYITSSFTLTNCTVSGNTAGMWGGGVYLDNYIMSSLTLTNCTLTGNKAYYGGGVCVSDSSPVIRGSIVAGNTAENSGDEVYTKGSITWSPAPPTASNNYSIIGYTDGYTADTVFANGAPALAANGGPTQTILPGTAAMDAIPSTENWLPTTDQRGFARISNGAADIGAVEMQQPTGFTITPNITAMTVGDTETLAVTAIQPADTDTAAPTWSSSAPGVLSVDKDGKLTAKAGQRKRRS